MSSRRRGPAPDRAVSLASPAPRRHGLGALASAAAIASRSVADLDDPQPGDARARPPRGRLAGRWPVRTRAGRPRAGGAPAGHAAELAEQARPRRWPRVPAATGRSRREEARARASGRSRPGSATAQAAGQVGVDVVRAEADPGPPAEDGDEEAQPVGVEAARPPGGRAVAGRRHQRLDLDEERTAALQGRRDDAARRRRPACSTRNARAGSGTSISPSPAISKTPTSSVEPKRFLAARTSAQRRVALAFERRRPRRRGARGSWARRWSRPW